MSDWAVDVDESVEVQLAREQGLIRRPLADLSYSSQRSPYSECIDVLLSLEESVGERCTGVGMDTSVLTFRHTQKTDKNRRNRISTGLAVLDDGDWGDFEAQSDQLRESPGAN